MSVERITSGSASVEVTQESLITGLVPNPFTVDELDLLKLMRDGVDGDFAIRRELGVKDIGLKRIRLSISDKVDAMYSGRGGDNVAKALSLSILGGWIEEPDYREQKAMLDRLEYAVVFQRSFGHTHLEVRNELHMTPRTYSGHLLSAKRKIGVSSDNQMIAWGASQARKYLKEQLGN